MTKRNSTVDILRVIGLILVIAAHCSFPEWFLRFREFDVVLLVFVSGMSYGLSRSDHKYLDYVIRRFRRLILPLWVFLIFFFIFFFLIGRRFSLSQMMQSFMLLAGGIYFVWVYRIMFTSSLLNPLMKKAGENRNMILLIVISALLLAVNDLLYQFLFANMHTAGKIMEYLITYTVGYGVISFLGIEFVKMNRREKLIMTAVYGVLFAVTAVILRLPDFYDWKYPPMLYYISYGLMCSGILYMILEHVQASNAAVRWLSANTMNIFVWHIFAYYLLEYLSEALLENVAVSFLFFMAVGILGAWAQEKVSGKLKGRV